MSLSLQKNTIMPRTGIKVKYLRTERFRNKKSVINIDFYEHGMAEVHVECKACWGCWKGRWRNHDNFSYIPFDECKLESMFDYLKALKVLDRDKVGRRWFVRKMRHCTGRFLKPDGRFDYEETKRIESGILHYSEIYVPALSESQLALLTTKYPRTAYRDKLRWVYFLEEEPEVRYPRSFDPRMTYTVLSFEEKLELVKELLPDFHRQIMKERAIDDCTLSIDLRWDGPTEANLRVFVSDNTYEFYTLPV